MYLTPVYPTGTLAGPGAPRRRRRLQGLGQATISQEIANVLAPGIPPLQLFMSPGISVLSTPAATPGSSLQDWIYNAAHGNVDPNQKQQITQQIAAEYQQSGMSPDQAQAQAQADVNHALNTVTAPGAFGITWTGANSSSPDWISTIANSLTTSTDPWFGVPIWVWLAGGGLALFLLVRK